MIKIKTKFVDIWNILVIKGANFFITACIFYITSKRISDEFVDFGLWWSVSVMIGGVLLGGTSSSLVRVVANTRSLGSLYSAALSYVRKYVKFASAILFPIVFVIAFMRTQIVVLAILAFIFGILFQIQTSIGSLLRVLEETRENIRISCVTMSVVPLSYFMLTSIRCNGLISAYFGLIISYSLALLLSAWVARSKLRLLLAPTTQIYPIGSFLQSLVAFSAVNLFSYVIVNIDFGILKLVDSHSQFKEFGNIKIYFERFVLPLWLVVAGAASIGVLRGAGISRDPSQMRFEFNIRKREFLLFLVAFSASTGFYYLYMREFQPHQKLPRVLLVSVASLGYLFYALNAILLDIFVLRNTVATTIKCLVAFFVIYIPCQYVIVSVFGAQGWALSWFIVNLMIFYFLSRSGVTLRV